MSTLHDGFLRALAAHLETGLAVVAGGTPWTCCMGAINNGPGGCTCWTPEYDLDQTDPPAQTVIDLAVGTRQPPVRTRMCGDCDYRPDSPEKNGDDAMAGDAELLERLAATGSKFYCHDGMRSPVAWVHPRGMRIPAAGVGDYQPPIVDGVPYRASGEPGLVCAGWNARHRALVARPEAGGES